MSDSPAADRGTLVVVDYGMGNIHSIIKALKLYHPDTVFTSDLEQIRRARALVLPGDGAFGAAMEHLSGPLEGALREHIAQQKPLLGVCIGFQVLFEDSDEVFHDSGARGAMDEGAGSQGAKGEGSSPQATLVKGLGVIPGHIRRFSLPAEFRIPHMGWNRIESGAAAGEGAGADYLNDSMYFIHSYRAQEVPEEYVLAWCRYDSDRCPAVVRKGSVLATQFHPEKSDRMGLRLIEEWVREAFA